MSGKFSGVKSERTVSKFRKKEKENVSVVFTYPIKRAREIRKFHVSVVQRRLRNVQKAFFLLDIQFVGLRCWLVVFSY